MEQTFQYIAFPRDIGSVISPDLTATLGKMEEICSHFNEAEHKKNVLDLLNPLYWQSLVFLLPECISKESKEEFEVPLTLHGWVNTGYVTQYACPDFNPFSLQEKQQYTSEEEVYKEYSVYYFVDWLQHVHAHNMRLAREKMLYVKLERAQKGLGNQPALLTDCKKRQDEYFQAHPAAEECVKVSQAIGERLPHVYEIKEKIEGGGFVSKEERIRYVELTNELNNLRELRVKLQRAIAHRVPQDKLMRLDREMEEIIRSKWELDKVYREAVAELEEDKKWRTEMSSVKCKEMLREEVRRIRQLIEIIGKRSQLKQCSIYGGSTQISTPRNIINALERIFDAVPCLYEKRQQGIHEFPRIIIVPGIGNGIYDFQQHALIIPLCFLRDLDQTVATALVEYYLDLPQSQKFRTAYQRLAKNRMVKSTIEIQQRMMKDFIGWITSEVKGYQVLDEETRKLFIDLIAPERFAIQQPRRMGALSVSDAHVLREKCEAHVAENPNDYDTNFTLGVVSWRLELHSKANIAFLKAFEIAPNAADACYNSAISCFKIGMAKKAVQLWRTYTTLDRQSFWRLRAQEFIRENS